MKKTKAEKALRILQAGLPLEYEGRKWYLSTDNKICVDMTKLSPGKEPTTVHMAVDVDVQWFLEIAEAISDDWYFIQLANMSLTEINRGRYKLTDM